MPIPPKQATLTRFLTRAEGASRRWTQWVDLKGQLLQSREALLEAHRGKSAFLASMSHQLRTPLNTILLCSELLADELAGQGLERMTGDLDSIQGAGRHLLALLDDIIDLSRMEAGRMIFLREATDLPALVERLAAAFRPMASKQGTTLTTLLPPDLPPLDTDPGKLEQILHHLLDNALKHTRSGAVSLELSASGPAIRFTVRDTGRGIQPEQLERIRLDFAQTRDTHRQAFGTSGLGLTLCRRLTEGLDGRIQAESILGTGSTFTLDLPAR